MRVLSVFMITIVGIMIMLLVIGWSQLIFGREAFYIFLRGSSEANSLVSWITCIGGTVMVPIGIYVAIKFDNETMPKKYYIEYSDAVGWGVMTECSVLTSCSLRGAFEQIREWSMYTSRHRHCTYEQFKWYVWMGRCSVDCLFPVPKKLQDKSKEEILAYYRPYKLGKGFRERIKGKRKE